MLPFPSISSLPWSQALNARIVKFKLTTKQKYIKAININYSLLYYINL